MPSLEADAAWDDAEALIVGLDVHPVDHVAFEQAGEPLDQRGAGPGCLGRDIGDVLGAIGAAEFAGEEPALHQEPPADQQLGRASIGYRFEHEGKRRHVRSGLCVRCRRGERPAEQEQGSGPLLPAMRHRSLPIAWAAKLSGFGSDLGGGLSVLELVLRAFGAALPPFALRIVPLPQRSGGRNWKDSGLGEVHRPVGFPSGAVIGGEGLFPARDVGVGAEP